MELSFIEVKDITLIPSHPIDWKKDIRIYVTNLSWLDLPKKTLVDWYTKRGLVCLWSL